MLNSRFTYKWLKIIPLSFILMHFCFDNTIFPLTTLISYEILTLIFFGYRLFQNFSLSIACLILFPWFIWIFYQTDFINFIQSYLYYFTSILSIYILILLINKEIWNRISLTFIKLISIISFFSILQIVMFEVFNINLFNPFGSFTYLYEYNEYLNGIIRAPGVFLEPSVNARMICLGILVWFFSENRKNICLLVMILGLLSTKSTSGYILLFIPFTLYYLRQLNLRNFIILLSCFLILLFIFNLEYILRRFNEINIDNSSGYYRITAPLKLVYDILSSSLFGYPLGYQEIYCSQKNYMLLEHRINNGLATIIFNFGYIGIMLLILYFSKIVSLFIKNKQSIILYSFLLLLIGGTGAIYTPEIAFSILFILLINKYHEEKKYIIHKY